MLKDVFTPAATATSPAPIYVTLPGQDGQQAGVPLNTFFDLEDHRWQRFKEEQEFKDKRETATVGRDFLEEIAKVVGKIGE